MEFESISLLRNKLDALQAQRSALELEADAIQSELTSPGPNGEPPAGIKEPLVDDEGFPRGDIDLYNVKNKRKRLSEINTDHKKLMKSIEEMLLRLYSVSKSQAEKMCSSDEQPFSNAGRDESMNIKMPSAIIAILDEVLDNSPAAMAGIKNGDRLIEFGTINASTPNYFQTIAKLVGESISKEIAVIVHREDKESKEIIEHRLTLVPRTWGGRGLLGCHLSPVTNASK